MDVGTEFWLSLMLDNVIAARKLACQGEMNALARLNEFREQQLPPCDKQVQRKRIKTLSMNENLISRKRAVRLR